MDEFTSPGSAQAHAGLSLQLPVFPGQMLATDLRVDSSLGPVLWFTYRLAESERFLVGAVRQSLETMTLNGKPNVCAWQFADSESQVNDIESEVLQTLEQYWRATVELTAGEFA